MTMFRVSNPFKGLGLIPLDFLLIPLGIFFFEVSVLISDVVRHEKEAHAHDYLAHLIHFILLYTFIYLIRKLLGLLKIENLRISALVSLGVFFGCFSELAFHFLFDLLNTHHQRGLALSIRTIFFLGTIWFPIAVIISSKFRTIPIFIREFEHDLLINARIKLRESKKNALAEQEIEQDIIERLRSQTSELARRISFSDQKLAESNVIRIQELLRVNSLRSLSAELESRGNKRTSFSSISQSFRVINIFIRQLHTFIKISLKTEKIPTSIVCLIFLLGIIPSMLNTLPFGRSLLAIAIIAVLAIAITNFPDFLSGRKKPINVRLRIISYFLLCYLPLISNVVSQVIFPYPGGHTPFLITVVNFPVLFAIELAIAQALVPIFKGTVSQLAYVPSEAILNLKLKKIHEELEARLSHQWAVYIHGNMLTRFATTSLRMQQALENNDSESFNKLRTSLIDLLQNPTAEFHTEVLKLSDELSTRIDPWIGILEVELKLEDSLKDLRNERVQDIGDVIEEILSNSVRHGGSTKIEVEISKSDSNTIKIYAIDNPTKTPNFQGSNPGLGTKIFNLVSDGRWKLQHNQGETIFTCFISVNG